MKSIYLFSILVIVSCSKQIHQNNAIVPAIYSEEFLLYENKDFSLQLDDFLDCNKELFLRKPSLENLKAELEKSNLNITSINCKNHISKTNEIGKLEGNFEYESKSALTEKSSFIFVFKNDELKSYVKVSGDKCNGFWCFQEETEQLKEYYIWKMHHLAIDISPQPDRELMYYCVYKINLNGQIEILDEVTAKNIIDGSEY
ncbi:MAG: hypothetical protein WCY16_09950 [Weeksellaceae bacterium]